jgi:hypothetical protein
MGRVAWTGSCVHRALGEHTPEDPIVLKKSPTNFAEVVGLCEAAFVMEHVRRK